MKSFSSLRLAAAVAATLLMPQASFAADTAVQAGTYKIDSAHSTALWKVLHMGISHNYGRFNDVQGTIVIDDKDHSKDSVEVTIKADSLDTANPKRDQHLKSPDFFNTKQFADLNFKSTKVTKVDEKTYTVDGNLTIHGVAKPVSFKFNVVGVSADPKGVKAGGETEFTIKRSDFGMSGMMQGIGDEITLILSVEAAKQ